VTVDMSRYEANERMPRVVTHRSVDEASEDHAERVTNARGGFDPLTAPSLGYAAAQTHALRTLGAIPGGGMLAVWPRVSDRDRAVGVYR
jgi:hypothetical protein